MIRLTNENVQDIRRLVMRLNRVADAAELLEQGEVNDEVSGEVLVLLAVNERIFNGGKDGTVRTRETRGTDSVSRIPTVHERSFRRGESGDRPSDSGA